MSETSSNILRDVGAEAAILVPTIMALRKRGVNWAEVWRYLAGRTLSAEEFDFSEPAWKTPEGFGLYGRRDFIAYRELFLLDEYDSSAWADEFEQQKAPLVLDVGANVGMFAMLCRHMNQTCDIVCFELLKECSGVIRERFAVAGQKSPRVITAAVGSSDGGNVEIHFDLPYAMGNGIHRSGSRSREVATLTLDSALRGEEMKVAPFLAKIDVEGAEPEVVRGGCNALSRARYVCLEIHGDANRTLLEELSLSHRIISDRSKHRGVGVVLLKKR